MMPTIATEVPSLDDIHVRTRSQNHCGQTRSVTRFAADIVPNPVAIAGLTGDVADFLRTAGVDARAVHHVALVIEEILTNVATHGGSPDAQATVALEVQPDRIAGEIGDSGEPFDPRSGPDPDISAPLEERRIGGLGLHLVRKLTSALDYRRDGKQNRTAFCIPREQDRGLNNGPQ